MSEESRLPENFKPLIGTEEANMDDKGRILVSKKNVTGVKIGPPMIFLYSELAPVK